MLISDFENVNNQIHMFVFKIARSNFTEACAQVWNSEQNQMMNNSGFDLSVLDVPTLNNLSVSSNIYKYTERLKDQHWSELAGTRSAQRISIDQYWSELAGSETQWKMVEVGQNLFSLNERVIRLIHIA